MRKVETPTHIIRVATTSILLKHLIYFFREERHYFMKDWAKFAKDRNRREIWELDTKILAQQEILYFIHNYHYNVINPGKLYS